MAETTWIFYSNKRYHVTHGFDDDLCDVYFENQDVFEVDERIAEPVAMLCNKGYLTEYSCSGHPFSDCSYEVFENEQDFESTEYVAKKQDSDTKGFYVCYLKEKPNDQMYISFKEPYKFELLPEGWTYEGQQKLMKNIYANDAVDFFKQSIVAIEKLTEWIKRLPERNNMMTEER